MTNLKSIASKSWKFLVGATVGIAAASAAPAQTPEPFDCKGTDCQIQVKVNKPNFKDAIYYKPDQWEQKTAQDLEAEQDDRFNKWKALVEEQSKKDEPVDEPTSQAEDFEQMFTRLEHAGNELTKNLNLLADKLDEVPTP